MPVIENLPVTAAHAPAPDFTRAMVDTGFHDDLGQALKIAVVENSFITATGRYALTRSDAGPALLSDVFNHEVIGHGEAITIDVEQALSPENPVLDDAAMLHGPWPWAFYHWYEELNKVVMLERAGFRGVYIVPAVGFVGDSLEYIGIDRARIRTDEQNFVVRRLWVAPKVNLTMLVRTSQPFVALRERLLAAIAPHENIERRLFVTRGSGATSNRDLVNKEAVQALLFRFGFEKVDFGKLPFREQVAMASTASAMVGAHGAAFSNAICMKRKGLLLEFFSPLYINYSYTPHIRHLGLRYIPLTADNYDWGESYAYGMDAVVNTDLLESLLAVELA